MPGPLTRRDRRKILGIHGNDDAVLSSMVGYLISKRDSLKFNESSPQTDAIGDVMKLTVGTYDAAGDRVNAFDHRAPLAVHVLSDSGAVTILDAQPVELVNEVVDGVGLHQAQVRVSGSGSATLSLSGTASTVGLDLSDTMSVTFS